MSITKEYVLRVELDPCEKTAQNCGLNESIIRCANCKWYESSSNLCNYFQFDYYDEATEQNDSWNAIVRPDGYCAWGEARE